LHAGVSHGGEITFYSDMIGGRVSTDQVRRSAGRRTYQKQDSHLDRQHEERQEAEVRRLLQPLVREEHLSRGGGGGGGRPLVARAAPAPAAAGSTCVRGGGAARLAAVDGPPRQPLSRWSQADEDGPQVRDCHVASTGSAFSAIGVSSSCSTARQRPRRRRRGRRGAASPAAAAAAAAAAPSAGRPASRQLLEPRWLVK